MRSFKNHLSLIIALFSIIFTVQIFIVVDRSINAYEKKLKDEYSMIVIVKKGFDKQLLVNANPLIASVVELSPDHIVDKLKSEISNQNFKLLKLSLPTFYKVRLNRFPRPKEIKKLTSAITKITNVTKVEDFSSNHDVTYKLLLLFKTITEIFSIAMIAVTSLLILKEMKIWQFQHNERMSIMALFGAPIWLRSAVLFRLAIVDALISSLLVSATFFLAKTNGKVANELSQLGISVELFNGVDDLLKLVLIALCLSVVLATMIVIANREDRYA
ncbi:MAG: cell division protein FtsX [Helicobacteraceae bacterium]|nr:cell division protein FtsX [Helicobacteraceae bacterium]